MAPRSARGALRRGCEDDWGRFLQPSAAAQPASAREKGSGTSVAEAREGGDALLRALAARPREARPREPGRAASPPGSAGRGSEAAGPAGSRPRAAAQQAGAAGGEARTRVRTQAREFSALLSCFEELANSQGAPTPLAEALERLRPVVEGGTNFVWDRASAAQGAHGGALSLAFQLVLWCRERDDRSMKTRTLTKVRFLSRPGATYIYQPVVPVTSLLMEPRYSFRPMFELDPLRSFTVFKVAWKRYLDLGVTDYRTVVGEQLDRWTARCKVVIERPFNATYWLMLMVGSYYRETLVQRGVVNKLRDPPERVPVICVDSFVSLSALLFTPERQVLYAGVDPTEPYLSWLQHVGEQNRRPAGAGGASTVFETNEFLGLAVIIVYYGRVQQKVKEGHRLSWAGSPDLVKSYIRKYTADNRCRSQLEPAARLYAVSCALGARRGAGGPGAEGEEWYCWNGLRVCEIGVPMPCTQAAFLVPFLTATPAATLCPEHGPDAARGPPERKGRAASLESGSVSGRLARPGASSRLRSPGQPSSVSAGSTVADSEESEEEPLPSRHGSGVFDLSACTRQDSERPPRGGRRGPRCCCARYVGGSDAPPRGRRGHRADGPAEEAAAEEEALRAVGDYDIVHCFAAVLAGGLNLAKQTLRVHFSIDPAAYACLPHPHSATWEERVLPWYRELHRPDAHGRSRYSALLERVVAGLLGDGYTSGYHCEVLDTLRASQDMLKEEAVAAQRNSKDDGSALVEPASSRTSKDGWGAAADAALSASYWLGPRQESPLARLRKGVISDIALWAELYETESLVNHREHFTSFAQWCHSAQLVPFLRRCYRRFGVAGLLPRGQSSGGHRLGAVPDHPLALPTVPNCCYGHCYPVHKVLQYFYGGMRDIVCSVDDPRQTEAQLASLRLVPGQERLNGQCWFEPAPARLPSRQAEEPPEASEVTAPTPTSRASTRRKSLAAPLGRGPPVPGPHADPKATLAPGLSVGLSRALRGRRARAAGDRSSGVGTSAIAAAAQASAAAPKSPAPPRARPGVMGPDDPFFWFCQQSHALHTNTAGRRQRLDPAALQCWYTDFASRSGTPEPRPRPRPKDSEPRDEEVEGRGKTKAVLPSICVAQPTDLSSWDRQRWEVQKRFADQRSMILGDGAWFPGALGHRFTFEAKTDNVDTFMALETVPTVQLLYLEHVLLPAGSGGGGASDSSGSEGSGDEAGVLPWGAGAAAAGRRRGRRRGAGEKQASPTVMLPRLLLPSGS